MFRLICTVSDQSDRNDRNKSVLINHFISVTVLTFAVHIAELEVSLMTLYNPELLNSLEEVKDMGTSTTHFFKEDSFKN
jgi:hypothetical protein